MEEILFYNYKEKYGEFSNYYRRDMVIDGVTYKSVEHYIQSQKSTDESYVQSILLAPTPEDAKKLGNPPEKIIRKDWESWRIIAMHKGLFYKFTQNEDLRNLLLSTGDAVIHENCKDNYYWGVGADNTGFSMLGKLLMELREELRTFYK